jgi:hypothetical protein
MLSTFSAQVSGNLELLVQEKETPSVVQRAVS